MDVPLMDSPPENNEQLVNQSVNGDNDGGSGLNANQGKNSEKSGMNNKDNDKKSYASLFKDNRAPIEASLLNYIPPPAGKFVIEADEIDSIEETYGFCLIGYVMGNRPGPFAKLNYIKGWGGNVKFKLMDNGWIKFQFENEAHRDRVLNGGTYMIMGRRLFLKKMPDCFLFRKEDMEAIPTWIQIYGLPKQCWNSKVLSRVASIVGKPIHTDLLTISKKGATYARVIVEIDAKLPRVFDCEVVLPSGIATLIKFKYEFEPKYCSKCSSLGHNIEMCGIDTRRKQYTKHCKNDPNKDLQAETSKVENTTAESENAPESSGPMDIVGDIPIPESPKDQRPKADHGKGIIEENSDSGDKHCRYDSEDGDEFPFDEDASNDFHNEEYAFESDEIDDILSKVDTQDKEEWKTVANKKKKAKSKKQSKKNPKNKAKTDGNSSLDTEYIPVDPTTMQPILGQGPKIFKKRNMEGRPPDTALGGQ